MAGRLFSSNADAGCILLKRALQELNRMWVGIRHHAAERATLTGFKENLSIVWQISHFWPVLFVNRPERLDHERNLVQIGFAWEESTTR